MKTGSWLNPSRARLGPEVRAKKPVAPKRKRRRPAA